jgi:poly(A) polymerase
VTKLAADDAQLPPLPSGSGDEIMRAFGLPPSRKIGDVKRMLEQAVETGEVAARQEADAYVEFVRVNRERFGI